MEKQQGVIVPRIYNCWLSFACDSEFKNSVQAIADQLGIGKSAFMRLLMERGLEHYSKDPMFLFEGAKASK